MDKLWPESLPVKYLRFARPTDNMNKVIKFYKDGIGLQELFRFDKHEGYKGVILGLPDLSYQLEFTSHEQGSPCHTPTKDNLLVFYIPNQEALNRKVSQMKKLGYHALEPENPYWKKKKSVTFEDPDGWRIVFINYSFEI